MMTEFFAPACALDVRWNNPDFGIARLIADPIIHKWDKNYPDFLG